MKTTTTNLLSLIKGTAKFIGLEPEKVTSTHLEKFIKKTEGQEVDLFSFEGEDWSIEMDDEGSTKAVVFINRPSLHLIEDAANLIHALQIIRLN